MRRSTPFRQLLGYGGALVAVILLYELAFAARGGGIYSILSAVAAVHAKAPTVDVDANGLRSPIFLVLGAIALLLCGLGHIDPDRRWSNLLVLFAVFGGGIIITAIYEEPIVTRYMTAHGYHRCGARDDRIGYGKSSIWFDDYARAPADCRAR